MPDWVFTGSLTQSMPQYGAANGQGIGQLRFDDDAGAVGGGAFSGGIDDTAWLVVDAKRHVLFTTCEVTGTNQSAVAAYAIEDRGLRRINTQPTGGNEACHATLSGDGRFLLVANYNGANPEGAPDAALCVLPIRADGSLDRSVASVRHHGMGPHPDRQRTAHAHCVAQSPTDGTIYVADLGMDRLVAYRMGENGSLTPMPERDFACPAGLGPRHLVFHPDGSALFVVSELTPTVLSLAVDKATGALSQRDVFPIAAPEGGAVQPAGIVLAPDQRHLFVSLRLADEILALRIEADGTLTSTARVPSGGSTPRDIAFSPTGRHLLVANQDSDRISVLGVDHATGTLTPPLQHWPVGTPMSVKLATIA